MRGSMISSRWFNVTSAIVGPVVVTVGRIASLVQSMLRLQAPKESLNDREREVVKRVFRNSLGVSKIRLIKGKSGVFGIRNPRAFTLGNTIYLKEYDTKKRPDLLVHECMHIWQYQHLGSRYATDALGAQLFVADEYKWEKEIERGHENWVDFNKESQAQFFQDIYKDGQLTVNGTDTTTGKGAYFDADGQTKIGKFVRNGTDHTNIANAAIVVVRG